MSSKNVLIIDDDKKFADLVSSVLKKRGYSTNILNFKDDYEEYIHDNIPDILVLGTQSDHNKYLDHLRNAQTVYDNLRIAFIAHNKESSDRLKPVLMHEFGVKIVASKPLIPFIFCAQIDYLLTNNDNLSAQKLKDFENSYLALVAKYAKDLPKKLEILADLVYKIKLNNQDIDSVTELRAEAHKIKGTGGSLGLSKISEVMAKMESSSVIVINNPNDNHLERIESFTHLMDEANQLLIDEVKEILKIAESSTDNNKNNDKFTSVAKIIVVDEDIEFLKFIENLGKSSSIEVLKASNSLEALNIATAHPVDAALINVQASNPKESFRLAKAIREIKDLESLPLAFIADCDSVKDEAEAAHAGASLYLDKPIDFNSLQTAVQHLINIREGGRPRVLVVDDDEYILNLARIVLEDAGMIVRGLADPKYVLDVMQSFSPELLLLDVMMPGILGFDVCRNLRQIPRWRDLSIIFLTAQTELENRIEAFACGGDDYIPKPFENKELLTRVKIRLERSRMIRERFDKDAITGLFLRRAFTENINSMLGEAQRTNIPLAICLIDVDHFKNVNDTYGHLSGDNVLSALGQLLSKRFRAEDLRGRWGGEEFIVAFRHETKYTMQKAINRILEEFSQIVFKGEKQEEFNVTFSGGIAEFPVDGESLHTLVQIADKRLYIAKHRGRKQIITDDEKN